MKLFKVGGAVRDELLGLTPHDTDYIVLDSNESEMINLGFIKVGKSHGVYLHPETSEEYTLALNNSLYDELLRRDLTINSIAQSLETGETFDPLGGIDDIEKKVLRHNPFFIDDPVRILRLLRLKSKLKGFEIYSETHLMLKKQLQNENLFEKIASERIVSELLKGFDSDFSNQFIEQLNTYSVLQVICGKIINLRKFKQFHRSTLRQKMALILSANSIETLLVLFKTIIFPKKVNTFCLNYKRVTLLKIKSNGHDLLQALELIKWSDDAGDFNLYINCLNTHGYRDVAKILIQGRQSLKALNFKDASFTKDLKDIAVYIQDMKLQALTGLF